VCAQWRRLAQDPSLRVEALHSIELFEREKHEKNVTEKVHTSQQLCVSIKPVAFCISDLFHWQKEMNRLLVPFPLAFKPKTTIPQVLASVRVLVRLTKLCFMLDQWKKAVQTIVPKLKDCFTYFQQNYLTLKPGPSAVSSSVVGHSHLHSPTRASTTISSSSTSSTTTPPSSGASTALIEQHEINRLGSLSFFGDLFAFLNAKSLRDVFCNTQSGGLATPALAGQLCYVIDVLMLMLKKLRFQSATELETILEYLGVCCLWMSLSGYSNQAKKYSDSDFAPRKIFKAMKEFESYIPPWILDALEDTEFVTEKTFLALSGR